MAKANSTRVLATEEGFPLSLHKASGNYCKTINGKRYYFGKDREAALARYRKEHDDLLAGRIPGSRQSIKPARRKSDFPLFVHKASGHYCKTINGKRYYFGKDREAGLKRYLAERDHLLTGRKPPSREDENLVTVRMRAITS